MSPITQDLDKLAAWLKATDSLGVFDDETDQLNDRSREAQANLTKAIESALASQVAEDDIAFLEAIEPVKLALAGVKKGLADWEAFLAKIEPRL